MRKPVVGEIIYSLNVGNAFSRYREQELTPVKVTKVGRKYFSCQGISESGELSRWLVSGEYHIDTWIERTDYAPTSKLYECKQSWLDEKEHREISQEISKYFNYMNGNSSLSLEQLRKIKSVIGGI